MAAGEEPRCPGCQRKQALVPLPESGQPLIESKQCQSCRKLQKTFVDLPRPSFSRSVSCPAGSNVVSYVQHDENELSAFLTEEGEKDNSASVTKIDIGVNFDSELLPRQPVCRGISKQTVVIIAICLSIALIALICVVLNGLFSGDRRPTHNPPSPMNHDLPRNVTAVPHHRHCTSHSIFVVDVSDPKDSDNQSTTVSFRLVNSSDNSVSLLADGQTVLFNKPGFYDIDVDFIMDTYSLDSVSKDRPYHQNLCLNITGRPPVCRPLIIRGLMRLPLRVHAKVRAHYRQKLFVFVRNHKMLFPDPNGNILSIVKRHC